MAPTLNIAFFVVCFCFAVLSPNKSFGHEPGEYVVTECDVLMSAPFDPRRRSAAVLDGNLDKVQGQIKCQEAMVLFPQHPRFRVLLARAIMSTAGWFPKKSEEVYSLLSLAQEQNYTAANFLLGNYFYREGGFMLPHKEVPQQKRSYFNRMIESYQRYIDSVEEHSYALVQLARVYEAMGRQKKVLLHLDKAISMGNINALTQKGRYLFEAVSRKEGRKNLVLASQLGDGRADYWLSEFYLRGDVLNLTVEDLVLSKMHFARAKKQKAVAPHILGFVEKKLNRILKEFPRINAKFDFIYEAATAARSEDLVFSLEEAVSLASRQFDSAKKEY
ncbi:tetratricopeptide repeat protein [Aestuariispira insulae]|uniref:Uncharacterized protein n=1 Tax=Aestuariispira insulae TaxID=1461337 RepID=A0A3D9H2F0_9PROT|nr:hypothetical protein [Aestuariispira insulae]RED43341.1 hypothetical protein DFP90_1252 [Aestuariispira insulae]